MQLGKKEKSLLTAEANMNALNEMVQSVKETERKLLADNQELNKVATAVANDSEREKKMFQ